LGATCTKGVCDPIVIASQQSGPWDVATNGSVVVWSNIVTDQIMMWSPNAPDGGVTVLAAGETSPKGVAIDSSYAYWAAAGDHTVRKSSLGGGTPTTLATTTITPYAVAVDATNVYWTEDGQSYVMKVPIGGGTPTPLAAAH